MENILIMAKSLSGGGTEVALVEFINHIDTNRYRVTLMLLDNDDEFKYRLKKDVEIEYIQFKNNFVKNLFSMESTLAKVIKKVKINKVFDFYALFFSQVENNFSEEYDIAIDFYGYGYFLTGFLAKKVRARKKATWLHDEKMDWIQNVERYLPKYDRVYSVGKTVKKEFIHRYPEFKERADVFYNFYDIAEIKRKALLPVKEKLNKNFRIVTVGRLHKQKGYDIAIATAEILSKKSLDFTWYVVGDGRDKKKLQHLVEQKKLNDRFIFLGRRDNPYAYMNAADVYVQPSRHEGFCTTTVEAKILGKTVVTTDLESFKEQFGDGTGYVVSKNPSELSDVILEIYDKEEYVGEKSVDIEELLPGNKNKLLDEWKD